MPFGEWIWRMKCYNVTNTIIPEVPVLPRILSFSLVILSFVVILPLAGCSAGPEPVLTSEEEALSKAKELFPEYFQGDVEDIDISHSDEFYERTGFENILQENTWYLNWQDENGYIRIDLSAWDGSLSSFDYQHKYHPEMDFERLLSRKEAEKIAYDFACRFYRSRLDSMVPDKNRSEYADESRLNLEYDFGWSRVIDGIPVGQDSIQVSLNALTGKVTRFDCDWNEVHQPKVKIMDSEELAELILKQVGMCPMYIETASPDGSFLKAKLVYRLNTNSSLFSAVSGTPVQYFGEKTSLADSKTYHQELIPLPAPELKVAVLPPGKRKSFEEAERLAAAFLEKQGHKGPLRVGGKEWDSGPPYPRESWRFASKDTFDSQWEDVAVWIDSAFGQIYRFSRMPKEEKALFPFLQLTRQEAEQSALEFLAGINEDTGNTVLTVDKKSYYSESRKKIDAWAFTWVRLVNGVPFPADNITVTVSCNSGEVISFARDYPLASVFEATQGILSPEEAAQAWKAAGPFELAYMLTGDYLEGKMKLGLVYSLDFHFIDAHTGEIIEFPDTPKRLGPYLEKIEGHWAEIPLDLLAQTGRLPDPEDFDPDDIVTRREYLRILEGIGHEDSEEGLYSPFEDISVNDPDIWAILDAVWCGIIEPGGSLRPEEPLTREDAAVWLMKLVSNLRQETLLNPPNLQFSDADKIHPDKGDYVAFAQEFGIISGGKDVSFRPQDPVTWGELAVMLARAVPNFEL